MKNTLQTLPLKCAVHRNSLVILHVLTENLLAVISDMGKNDTCCVAAVPVDVRVSDRLRIKGISIIFKREGKCRCRRWG